MPYDSRITYIETDGQAYIDTGVNLRSICKADFGLELKQIPSSTFVPYGIWYDDSSGPRNQMAYINNGQWKDPDTSYTNTTGVSGTASVDTPYGITATSKKTYANDATNYFLTRNANGSPGSLYANIQARYLRVSQDNQFVLDTYPVRVGTVGYLYDSINRVLIGNAGSGAFRIGSDTPFTISRLNNQMPNQRQGMAIYNNIVARANAGTNLQIYSISPIGDFTLLQTNTLPSSSHNNSMQFAPMLEQGQVLPYLYSCEVAVNANRCDVYSFSSSYETTLVQTITLSIDGIPGGCNLQIGEDGYIWGAANVANDKWRFIKFRQVSVQEGNVTLTDADIVDDWTTTESFPYSSYVWQGMVIKRGKIWFSYGATGSGKNRGIAIFDTNTHNRLATWDCSYYNFEYEDLDFWGNSILLCTYGTIIFRITFDEI